MTTTIEDLRNRAKNIDTVFDSRRFAQDICEYLASREQAAGEGGEGAIVTIRWEELNGLRTRLAAVERERDELRALARYGVVSSVQRDKRRG